MNERIRELAKQACFDEIGKDYSLYFNLTKDKVEKFAELIVKECAQLVEDKFDFCGYEITIAEQVRKHFGIIQ
jgi:hypothetical protein